MRKLTKAKTIADSIPKSLKEYFYCDKVKPNLLQDYDAIGFDTDHCLVKYNIKPMVDLIVKGHLEELVA